MKISLEWQDSYNIGIEEIDFQHKYFLKLIKRFALITEETLEENYLKRLLREISYYAVFHFCSEENMMINEDYPSLKVHQTLHKDLVSQLESEINNLAYDKSNIINLIAFLANWFLNHTLNEDQKFAQFLRDKSN